MTENQPTLAERIQRLEDVEAIHNLRSAYHEYINDTEFDRVAGLFTPNGYLHVGYMAPEGQPWRGRDEIAASLSDLATSTVTSQLKQFPHMHTVKVTGPDTAVGTALLEACYGIGSESFLVAGKYTDEYSRVDGIWLFSRMAFALYFTVPLSEGWSGPNRHQLVNSGQVIPDLVELRPNPAI